MRSMLPTAAQEQVGAAAPAPAGARSASLHIQLLGGFALRSAGEPVVRLDLPRLQTLLAYLVLHHTMPTPRHYLAFVLWPDLPESRARANLRTLLHRLRNAFPAADSFILSDGQRLHWCPEAPWTLDVAEFEGELVQAAAAARAADQLDRRAALERATELYRGDLLPGWYDDWVLRERERLRAAFLEALEQYVALLEAAGDYRAGIRAARRLLRHEPLHEAGYQHLMRLYARSGDYAAVVQVYQECVATLAGELEVEPSAATRELYERLRRQDQLPAAPASPAPPHTPADNLPAPLTNLIGRERQIKEVGALLATTRLLTLIGVGGAGKTRLALAVATGAATTYRNGVRLVELASLADEALLPQAVATALGMREEPERTATGALVEALRGQELLLVLDNCEHLVEACAALAETLLRACPRLRILATSREALRIAGEVAWRVPSLALPDPRRTSPVDALLQVESVQLFVERATAAWPGFALSEANAAAVVQICRHLDGIPLAIELAAARIGTLSAEQLAARLTASFRLLSDGSRTALPRQRTLRATIDWGYELLAEPERLVFRRLSVFAGGFGIDAVETVCAGALAADEVLELLARLTSKSLVAIEAPRGGEARYRLLETIRQYARERLVEAGESEEAQRGHMGHFLALAEAAEPELSGSQQALWLERLEAEHDNLRAALRRAVADSAPGPAVRLAGALWRFWWLHSHLSEGRRWLAEVLELPGAALDQAALARALHGAGVLADEQRDYAQAQSCYARSLALRREQGDTRGVAVTLNSMGVGAYYQGDDERAQMLLEGSLTLRRELAERPGISVVLNNLGLVARRQGAYRRAQALFEESLALSQQEGDLEGVAIALNNLGAVARDEHDYGAARAHFRESLMLFQQLGDRDGILESLEGLAISAGAAGQHQRAVRWLGAVEVLRQGLKGASSAREYEGALGAARSQLGPAAYTLAWAEGRKLTLEQALAEILDG